MKLRNKKLISDTLILGMGTFGSKLLVFLLMPFYTAWLSTDQYGTAELITSAANLLIPLACVGISNGIFRFAAERESNRTAVFSSGIFLFAVGSLVFLAVSPFLSFVHYFASYGWLIVAYVLSANLHAVCAQYVRAIDRPKLFAVQGILNTGLTVVLNILFLAVMEIGVLGYVLSVVLGNLITTIFLIFSERLWRVFRVSKISKPLLREMLWFSFPLIPTTVCWLITDLSDRYMVTYFCGEAANGIYSAAYKIPTIVNLIAGIFLQAWQFSAISNSSDETECKSFYSDVFRGFLSVIMIGAAGLILLSGALAHLLLSQSFFEAWRYMPTLLCAAAFEAIVAFLATVYMVKKKSMHSFLTAMVGALLNVVLNLLLIPKFGALGAAIATMLSYAAVLLVRLIDIPRLLRFRLCLQRLLLNACLLLGAAAVMTWVETGRLIWTFLLTAAIVALNAPALLGSLKGMLRQRSRKRK